MMSVIYTMTGLLQSSCSSRNPYFCFLEGVVHIVIIFCAIYFLGFFEAGQVGMCRLANWSDDDSSRGPSDNNGKKQNLEENSYYDQSLSLLLKPHGVERYLVGTCKVVQS
jgi:hypothetical protein